VEGEIAYQTRHDSKGNEAMMKTNWPRHFSFSVPVGNVSSNGEQKRTWILDVTRSLAICDVRV
jgi:hypothetical protein